MNREIRILDIFCFTLFFVVIATNLCHADEGKNLHFVELKTKFLKILKKRKKRKFEDYESEKINKLLNYCVTQ